MDEATAWYWQAVADRQAGERLAADRAPYARCQAIAKWQQAVEKAIKSLMAALRDAGVTHTEIGYGHAVARFLKLLNEIPHAHKYKDVQRLLHGLLNEQTRDGIRALDRLVPRRPPPGRKPGRNTEYPFQDARGQWTYPAAEGVFTSAEVDRFRSLAYRIVEGVGRLVLSVLRAP